jgi:hypothetical protein
MILAVGTLINKLCEKSFLFCGSTSFIPPFCGSWGPLKDQDMFLVEGETPAIPWVCCTESVILAWQIS